MIQDLVLPVTRTAGDAQALQDAIALAGALDARLAVLHLLNLPVPTVGPLGLSSDALYPELYAALREAAGKEAGQAEQHLRRAGIGGDVRVVETFASDPPYPLPLHARYADLAIVPGPGRDGDGRAADFFHAFLFESGRPVLMVPPRTPTTLPPGHAVVAWQPTREATRALHDALPLLELCRSIDVVVIDPRVGPTRHGEDPGADIAAHLARHGLAVNLVVKDGAGTGVAGALLRHCGESGAQLLVAGGYGHSRLKQWILGGTTRDLFENPDVPVLFSH